MLGAVQTRKAALAEAPVHVRRKGNRIGQVTSRHLTLGGA